MNVRRELSSTIENGDPPSIDGVDSSIDAVFAAAGFLRLVGGQVKMAFSLLF